MSAVCQCISQRKHNFSLGEIYPTDEKAGDDNNWVDDTAIMAFLKLSTVSSLPGSLRNIVQRYVSTDNYIVKKQKRYAHTFSIPFNLLFI